MDAWDPLHSPTDPDVHWTTANLGEAMPGVQTPLSWTVWSYPAEHSAREGAYAIGALTKEERQVPSPDRRFIRVFYGRVAAQVEFMTQIGDRMPGTSGPETAMSVFGLVPEDIEYRPSRSRWPAVAVRFPYAHAVTPRRAKALAADTDRWYRPTVEGVDAQGLDGARAVLREASGRLDAAMCVQSATIMAVAQPLFRAVTDVIESTGIGDLATLSGTGGAEIAVVSDIWATAHGRMTMAELQRRHGFHGPMEGELSSRVWREDPRPLEGLLDGYAGQPEPVRADADTALRDQQRRILAATPAGRRPVVKLLLHLAEHRLLVRGVAKRAFLQSFDVIRAAARQAGRQLPLDDPDDVFYLTADEVLGGATGDLRELVQLRRARRETYRAIELPGFWKGQPPTSAPTRRDTLAEVAGQGVSPGVAEGPVRVVTDPSFADVEPGEVLVAPTTDPSWASIMYLSAALVVDIGGPLSHAAVVARELGIPCIVSAAGASRTLRTGDVVRVDGGDGSVRVITRAAA